jgi:hypothetical protein
MKDKLTPAGIGLKHFQKAFQQLQANKESDIPSALIQAYAEAYREAVGEGYDNRDRTKAASFVFRFAAGYGCMVTEPKPEPEEAEKLVDRVIDALKTNEIFYRD